MDAWGHNHPSLLQLLWGTKVEAYLRPRKGDLRTVGLGRGGWGVCVAGRRRGGVEYYTCVSWCIPCSQRIWRSSRWHHTPPLSCQEVGKSFPTVPEAKIFYQKFQHEVLVTRFRVWCFSKTAMFEVEVSREGAGIWEEGWFWGTENSVLRGFWDWGRTWEEWALQGYQWEVSTLKKRCVKIRRTDVKREVGFGCKLCEALSHWGWQFLPPLCPWSAGLALWMALGDFLLFNCPVVSDSLQPHGL